LEAAPEELPEAILHGQTGFLVDRDDPDEIADRLLLLQNE